MSKIALYKSGSEICLIIQKGSRSYRFWMDEDDAQKLSNRLSSFAAGQQSSLIEMVLEDLP